MIAQPPQIVGIGLATLDVLIRLPKMPTWEEGVRFSGFRFDGGGPVGTGLVAASRLGARTAFIGTAGTDEAAELKIKSLAENGVDISHLVRRDGPEPNIVIVCVQEGTGERVFLGSSRPWDDPLGPEQLDREFILSASYLHLEGHHGEAALAAAQWMQAAGKMVVFDGAKTRGGVRPLTREIIRHVDVLICGEGFATALTGKEELWAAGQAAMRLGPRIVVQTVGDRGSYTLTADEWFHTPAFEVDVVDTTGAGDVFHGAYIVGLLHGWDLQHVAQFSSAVSAIKCIHLGGRTGIPTLPATLAFLRERGIELA